MKGPELITLGCRLNIAESEAMAAAAAGEDDLVIVNSCAVTAEAVRQTRAAIRKAARERPGARILVTGCASEIEPESFRAMPEVAGVLPNQHKLSALTTFVLSEVEVRAANEPLVPRASTTLSTNEGYSRAFVPVQNGCDHDCTFCIIPKGRGASRSVPAGQVIADIQRLVDRGHNEVVLTGVDLTSYGADLPGTPTLGSLVERILRHVPALPRLRLSSLDSIEIDERLFEIVTGEPRVMPHLHLSLQAGDDMVLKRMKRRHLRRDATAMVERLKGKRPEIAIGADLIAGFPTETEDMAANTLRLIEDCDIVHPHIFPFSPRPGTPAARMPQVAPDRVKARARALREAGEARRAAWLHGLVGTEQRVLVERGGKGHTEGFAAVTLTPLSNPVRAELVEAPAQPPSLALRQAQGERRVGEIHSVKVTALSGSTLLAEAA
ncbi:tRNA (N(6)-L-threonylcarbamoyladenosine(37)-C(2))-methylthiotransferase MtaB [Sphingomonas sp. ID0503]|uniref:tRNA (N(6)-L-threonylcarbamoyladenosine(37)-C(2))- methylthiotransferase MtaB n=1 Tax=Sphingomonas sp. ID0503 TaxID=3399691 RepID=UPI003AFA879B